MSPRYDVSKLTDEIPRGAACVRLHGPFWKEIGSSVRGWRKPDQRRQLYILSEVLKRWAARFDSRVVLALASGSMTFWSVGRCLRTVADWFNECEPQISGGEAARAPMHPDVLKHVQEVEEVLNAVELLNELATGGTVYWPSGSEPPIKEDRLGPHWELPDDEIEIYFRNLLGQEMGSADSVAQRDKLITVLDRLQDLAMHSVDRLQLAMEAPMHARGGLGLEATEKVVQRQPVGSRAIQIHEDMKQVLKDLQELAHGEDSKSATPAEWIECVERLIGCWAPWVDQCFVLHGSKGEYRQAKKKMLERLVACVTQYAYAMRGVEAFASDRFVHVVMCLGTLGTRMQALLAKIDKVPNELPAGAEAEVQDRINELDHLIIGDGVLDRWQSHFGVNSQTVGKTVEVIVTSGDGQDGPWQQGAKRGYVEDAGLLVGTDSARERKFNDRLVDMQRIAVAVQIPHELLAGKPMRPKHKGEKLHAAEDWLVNPLAAVLANEPVPIPARKAAGPTKQRSQATAKKKKPKKK